MTPPEPVPSDQPVLGVLVPCRNEEQVVDRRLANLARTEWPAARAPHRICLVDDGSTDATAQRARASIASRFAERDDVEAFVTPNDLRPGKSGAIARGIAALDGVDLLVLTDADVVVDPGALVALAAAFRDSGAAMVSGSQIFVRELSCDGTLRAPGGERLEPAGGLFDRATALVRRLESFSGRLFSVHGQLLAWRAASDIVPTPGIAADDLDLAFAVRARGGRVQLARGARFYEEKTPAGEAGEAQALRRARAYLQVVARPGASVGTGALDRLQFVLYRHVPIRFPELLGLSGLVLAATAVLEFGQLPGVVSAALLLLAAATPQGRELLRLASIIRRARLAERRETLSDRWEMERT